ncbi:MAG: T9SS type A sorting domain-containing protein [Lewinellaceae bacterium]|nr:T9SS type A sorting domain-containing protein [Lewinellaceae bacterium]
MKLSLLPFLTCFFILTISSFAQPGCPDPQASNFNAAATSNDGSCQYPLTGFTPVIKATLPAELKEVSGHVKVGNLWYAHNDGGDDSRFYRFDPETGSISQEVKLKDASNKDWEDITASSTDVYLGDFGNNNNDREDLGVYKVPVSEIGNSGSESINNDEWTFIPFHYADQTDFSTLPDDSTVFDCEAMIFFNGKLHLFSKNRRDNITSHYVINQATGVAEKIETFDTNGQISGADISPDGKVVALLGYNLEGLPTVFMWLLWDWQAGSDLVFSGNKRRIELGSAFLTGQAEGIGFADNRTGYLTNERTIANNITFVAESVRYFDIGEWVPESVATDDPQQAELFRVFPNPVSQEVHFQFFENKKPDQMRVVNLVGQVVLEENEAPETLNMGNIPPGIYTVEIISGTRMQAIKIIRQ